MNIIELATLLSVNSATMGSLTKTDFAEMESRLELEKQNHPHLTDELITSFFKAVKKDAPQFQAVLNNRALFNFFAKKNLSKKQFQEAVEEETKPAIQTFLQTYLIDELVPFVYDKIEANDFQDIALLTEAHELLPGRVSEKILFYATEKLEVANKTLKPPFGDFSKILYIKDAYFFTFLNGLKNDSIEEKVSTLFTTVMNMYITDKSSDLAKRTFTAMRNYDALDTQLSKNIGVLKESAEINYKPFAVNRRKYYWIYAVVAILVIGRVWMLVDDVSDMNSQYDNYQTYDDYETLSEPRQLDRYYTDMRFKIDSFRVFLADFNQDKIRRLTKISDIKTGQNPFETFYQNEPTGDSNNYIKVRNRSVYDLVLLENAILYDSIKIPRTAHFIKAGESIEVNFNSEDAKTVFNFYMGKKLATFQTESSHLFVRSGSIVEYRFSELAPNVKDVMSVGYFLKNDANIDFINGNLRVDSEGVLVEE